VSAEVTIGSRLVHRGRVIALRVDDVRLPSGRVVAREVIEHRGAVAVVPFTDDGHVILVRQYRKAAERELLEIPAGGLEPGEALEACARRELAEEARVAPRSLTRLVAFIPSPGIMTEVITIFVARGLTPIDHEAPGDEEGLRVVRVPVDRTRAMIDSGEICDAKSIIGLLLAAP
jgi:ADP-ribose pyrophosphatase